MRKRIILLAIGMETFAVDKAINCLSNQSCDVVIQDATEEVKKSDNSFLDNHIPFVLKDTFRPTLYLQNEIPRNKYIDKPIRNYKRR